MNVLIALIIGLASLLSPAPAPAEQLARCHLNPQIDSACQPAMLPVGAPVFANQEPGSVWGYYLEGDSRQYVYVILLDRVENGVYQGRFLPASLVVPR